MAEQAPRISLNPDSELAQQLKRATDEARHLEFDTGDAVYDVSVQRHNPAGPIAAASWRDASLASWPPPPPTPDELARRRAAVERIVALRATMPSFAPLTSADLVRMGREEEATLYGPGH